MPDKSLRTLHVLVVDDHEPMRVLITALLRAMGFEQVLWAGDGGDALALCRRYKVDLIVTDLMMKPMDGLEFVRRLRADPSGVSRDAPVVMATGHAEREVVIAARAAGVDEFMVKPITARALASRVKRALDPEARAEAKRFYVA